MKGFFIRIRQICSIVTFCIILAAVMFGLIFEKIRTDFLAWLSFFAIFLFVAGYIAAWILNTIVAGKLKERFPEWKKEIALFCFGRLNIFRSPIISGDDLPSYMKNDPDIEIITAGRDFVRNISILWIYLPTIMLVLLILFFVFF